MLKIYVDRLRDSQTEVIEETASPDFLEVKEQDLQFLKPIRMSGKAYLAENHLIIKLKIITEATMPCLICNTSIQKKIHVPTFYLVEDVSNIKGNIYDYTEPMREAILLEVPYSVECMGNCPIRGELKSYLDNGKSRFPFADL